ncbi:MAG TPA: hypothetical protein PLM74_03310 [Bacillota bacterium]|jgi:hypothetical protein|nr:hypothetical protein [Bacillota bacterium]
MHHDEIVGVANTIPLWWDRPFEELPEEGTRPNTLGGLQAAIIPACRGRELSSSILLEMISLARRDGHRALILPVRPSRKRASTLFRALSCL